MASLSSFPSCFVAPLPHQSRLPYTRQIPLPAFRYTGSISSPLRLEASPLDAFDVPIGVPLVVLVAVILAFSAQSWINSLLGGDQGLGAFLGDGSGFKKSGFKPRKRPITDQRSIPGEDPTKPLGAGDPLPWLKLPEFDYVDVAGQPKKPKQQQPVQDMAQSQSTAKDDSEVIQKLESLRELMKLEIEMGDLQGAKKIEDEMLAIMKKEGINWK